MKIVLIGTGKVGKEIVKHICHEGHEVTVIDSNSETIEELVEQYDVMGICGNGASYEIQKSAGVDSADIMLAITSSDEVNILACLIAKKLGAAQTICRVRNNEYNEQVEWLKTDLGINMTFNPELETANEIKNIVNFPEALRVDSLADNKVDLVELYIPEDSPLIGLTLQNIHAKYQVKILVCAVQRGEDVFIPTGSFTFQAKDRIHITASKENVKNFLKKLGLIEDKIKNIIIIGGSKIAYYLIDALGTAKFNIKVIERDLKRCEYLSEEYPNISVICGDGSDQLLLQEEGINDCDAMICLTGIDEENIIISMYAAKVNVPKIITKVNKNSFAGLMQSIGGASVISPKEITASHIISYIRSETSDETSNLVKLYKLVNNKVEVLEFIANSSSKVINIPLKELKLKGKILIGSIIRENKVIIPSGVDKIYPHDRVVIITSGHILDDIDDILE